MDHMSPDEIPISQSRHHRRILIWGLIYTLLIAICVVAAYKIGQTFVTHTLPAGSIKLTTSKQTYTLGDEVSFSIHNGFDTAIYVNNSCPQEPLTVYKWNGKTWGRIHDTTSLSQCKDQARQIVVSANSNTNGSYSGWKHLFNKAGVYRLVAVVDNYQGLPYTDFRVVPPTPAVPKITQSQPTQSPTSSQPVAKQPTPLQQQTVKTAGGSIVVQYDATHIYLKSITNNPEYISAATASGQSTLEVKLTSEESQILVQMSMVGGKLTVHTSTSGTGNND